jgi:uncharacterized membrane protein
VKRSSRYLACVAYLLNLPGALYVLLARRDDSFAVYHARQSLALALAAILMPLAWAVCAWGLAWVPLLGPVLGVALFALMLAAYCGLLAAWLAGMLYALQGRVKRLPVIGPRLPEPAAPPAAPESTSELIERTSPSDA